jgi:glycosyltransferase involved in cell wall biosynthesis
VRDPEAMATALYRLASSQDLCHRMGAAARQRVIQEFGMSRQIEAFRLLFMSLAQENLGPPGQQ